MNNTTITLYEGATTLATRTDGLFQNAADQEIAFRFRFTIPIVAGRIYTARDHSPNLIRINAGDGRPMVRVACQSGRTVTFTFENAPPENQHYDTTITQGQIPGIHFMCE